MRLSDLKPSILHKGLIYLLVPFLLQVMLFSALLSQISDAEKFAKEKADRAEFLEKTSALIEDFGMGLTSIFTRLFSANRAKDVKPISPEEYRARMSRNLEGLNAVPNVGPRMRQVLSHATSICDTQYQLLKRLEKQSPASEDVPAMMLQLYSVKGDLAVAFREMNVIKGEIDAEREAVMQDGEIAEKKRASVKRLSVIFLLCELLLTGALLTYFLKDIRNRLNQLVGNARRLPEEEPITSSVRGHDEIAYLDRILHEASEKLIEARKNRQSLLNMITHDIRSPLMSSDLLVDILLTRAKSNDDKKSIETGERLRHTYKKVILLVEDLLLLEKGETKLNLNLEVADIAEICASALESVRPQADSKGVKIENAAEPCKLIIDKMRIEQVLINLLSNAVKFTERGGTVAISSENKAATVTVCVKDSGKGIAPDELAHLFERFFQSRESSREEGFGLGLAIAKMIVDEHDGKIGAHSEIAKGSTFWFTLPVDD